MFKQDGYIVIESIIEYRALSAVFTPPSEITESDPHYWGSMLHPEEGGNHTLIGVVISGFNATEASILNTIESKTGVLVLVTDKEKCLKHVYKDFKKFWISKKLSKCGYTCTKCKNFQAGMCISGVECVFMYEGSDINAYKSIHEHIRTQGTDRPKCAWCGATVSLDGECLFCYSKNEVKKASRGRFYTYLLINGMPRQ